MYLFDNLPLEIIHHEIFPNLDYSSRVVANAMLPPQDRISKKLDEDKILCIQIRISVLKLLKFLKSIEAIGFSNIGQRNRHILKMFRCLLKEDTTVFKYKLAVRNVVIEKARRFLQENEYEGTTPHMKKTLPPLCKSLLKIIEGVPFVREIPLLIQV
jgi:hypothetical protein